MALKMLTKDALVDKICVIIGTRPSIVKQSPIIRELKRQGLPHLVIHTGQHYSFELDRVFFKDLELPEPHFRLEGIEYCKFHGEQTAKMLSQIEQILIQEKPKTVLVGGDANTNLAGALAARKLNISLAHEEAGVRSFMWNVPEEHNRVIIDHISDYLFAPNEEAKEQLRRESVRGRILVAGSTITDAIEENLNLAKSKSSVLENLALERNKYILLTVHHEENVDYREEIVNIFEGIKGIRRAISMPIVFPVHPRTHQRLEHFQLLKELRQDKDIRLISPLGYFDFLVLLAHSAIAITDSGGVIQEAAILRVPCVTLGKYTEWRECVAIGANKVSMNNPKLIERYTLKLISGGRHWANPFGPSRSAKRIVDFLKSELSS